MSLLPFSSAPQRFSVFTYAFPVTSTLTTVNMVGPHSVYGISQLVHNVNVVFPLAAKNKGVDISINNGDDGAFNITLNTSGSDSLNYLGSGSITLANGQWGTFVSDGVSNWIRI